ncbi:MAG TPA: PA14 domain-containing protein [Pseudobacteroides sp.]|uniref:PA14 domain-containing protein n=1 Tax=Pseudobacteroides sp. TaxID=1968840 RepID=UPI002F95830C
MDKKGIIIYVGKHSVTVLTEDNGYFKLRRKPSMYVSQEIYIKKSDIINEFFILKRVSLVAAVVVFLVGIALYASILHNKSTFNDKVLAYVSLDINPSIQFAIDKDYKVMNADYLNRDAKELMVDLKPEGMKINEAFYIILSRCVDKGIVKENTKNYFLITGALQANINGKAETEANNDKLKNLLSSLKKDVGTMPGEANEIAVFQLNKNDIEAADKSGISLGRYALYKEIVKAGSKISLSDSKNFEVSDLIIAYEEVRKYADHSTPVPDNSDVPNTKQPDASVVTPVPSMKSSDLKNTPIIPSTPGISKAPSSKTNSPNMSNTPSSNKINSDKSSINPSTSKPSSVISLTPKPEEEGTGLRGEYYDNIDLTNLVKTRIDKYIYFMWVSDYPPTSALKNDESYSVRWTGYIKPQYTAEYTFYVTRDNGVRLWIDNKLIIDKWNDQFNVTDTGKIVLQGNEKYDIKIEFYNNTGNGLISLMWSSILMEKSIVPVSCLYPSTSELPVGTVFPGEGKGLTSEYYDNSDLTLLKASGIDKEINFNWGTGSPDKRINQDQKFSIRWTGYIQPINSEDYTFHIDYDGGVRLWIDDKLEINEWAETFKFSTRTREIALKAGHKHKIKLEYFNGALTGRVKLMWSSSSSEKSIVPMSRLFPED